MHQMQIAIKYLTLLMLNKRKFESRLLLIVHN